MLNFPTLLNQRRVFISKRFNLIKLQLSAVRNVPQRRLAAQISPKVKSNLEIGEHDLLPILLQEMPGLQLSKPVLDDAWRKQFRQIENLTKQESSHQAKKRANDLKVRWWQVVRVCVCASLFTCWQTDLAAIFSKLIEPQFQSDDFYTVFINCTK